MIRNPGLKTAGFHPHPRIILLLVVLFVSVAVCGMVPLRAAASPVTVIPHFGLSSTADGRAVAIRIDEVPASAATYLTSEYSLDGAEPQRLPRGRRDARVSFAIPDLTPGQPVSLRLRGVFFHDGRIVAGPWSGPRHITPRVLDLPRQNGRPVVLQPADWDIEPDPDISYALRIRLNGPPPGEVFSTLRLRRRSGEDLADLPAIVGQWQRVVLRPGAVTLGMREDYRLGLVAGTAVSGWSAPKAAALEWRDAPRPPEAAVPWDWFVRPTGMPGMALLEILTPPYANGAPLERIEARHAQADKMFAPTSAGWSDWQDVTGQLRADGTGTATLSGLRDGVTHIIEIRARNALGAGPAAVRKTVRPQAFTLPRDVVIGALNPAGTGRIRIPKGAGIADVAPGASSDWQILATDHSGWDYLLPVRDGPDLRPAQITLTDGAHLNIDIAPDTFAAETTQDVETWLRLPPARKSATTLLIGPEWINLSRSVPAFQGAFSGLAQPAALRPREPENGTLVSNWMIHESKADQVAGGVDIRDITFFAPVALRLDTILNLALGRGAFRDVSVADSRVLSDVMPARFGHRGYFSQIRAVLMGAGRNYAVTDSELAHIVYGISTGGQQVEIRGNTLHHLVADPLNIHYRKGSEAAPVVLRDIAIEGNTSHDFIGDAHLLHGDAFHMWMSGGGKAGAHTRLEGLRYRGNINFPGTEGLISPPTISAYFTLDLITAPMLAQLPGRVLRVGADADQRLLRVDASEGPVTVELLPAALTPGLARREGRQMSIAVQKGDLGPHTVRIIRASGTADTLDGETWQDIVLATPYAGRSMFVVTDDGDTPQGWTSQVPVTGAQGFYTDPNDLPLIGGEISGNILWGNSPNQILTRNLPQQGFGVHHNSALGFLPGDLDGDGQYNSAADQTRRYATNIGVGAADDTVTVWANISGRVSAYGAEATGHVPHIWNNTILPTVPDPALRQMFPAIMLNDPADPQSLVWYPGTRQQAIDMARPAAQSVPGQAGHGAVGATPATDWWDFATNRPNPARAAQPARVVRLDPAPGAVDVVPGIDHLGLLATQPLAVGEGEILLRDSDGTVRQSWVGPEQIRILGPELRLDLAAPLRADTGYRLEIGTDVLQGADGAALLGLPSAETWRFRVDPAARANLLPRPRPGEAPFVPALWQPLSQENDPIYRLLPQPKAVSIRYDSNTLPELLADGALTLSFDYGGLRGPAVGKPLVTAIRDMDGASVQVNWNDVPIGRTQVINRTIAARRTDISDAFDAPPRSYFHAELSWTAAPGVERRLIDLIRSLPAEGGIDIGRVRLEAGGLP